MKIFRKDVVIVEVIFGLLMPKKELNTLLQREHQKGSFYINFLEPLFVSPEKKIYIQVNLIRKIGAATFAMHRLDWDYLRRLRFLVRKKVQIYSEEELISDFIGRQDELIRFNIEKT